MLERTIPILPCRELDDVLPFYTALGFELTYRQDRPYPCLGVRRGGIDLQFFGMAGFDPATSYASVILLVPDTGVLYDAFAAGLRSAFGKLPITGIPRITRPRRKQGTAAGFSVVDPGGNWLRVTAGVDEDASHDRTEPSTPAGRLERVLLNAARQGDSRGDGRRAISLLEAGLLRHADAAQPVELVPVLTYLAELQVRVGDGPQALATLDRLDALDLDASARSSVAAELASAAETRDALS